MIKRAESLARLRQINGISQKQLAERMGVSAVTVWKWEAGRTTPGKDMLRRIEEIFGRPVMCKSERKMRRAGVRGTTADEMKLLKTFYNVRDMLQTDRLRVLDVIDIIFEYEDQDRIYGYLEKWRKLGFFYVPNCSHVGDGKFLWMLLPGEYMEGISDEHKRY